MTTFRFDPPLKIVSGLTIRTLEEAAAFVRSYRTSNRPAQRDAMLARLEGDDRVAFRYAQNPNGSRGDIAGVLSANRRVLGLMPHPERAADPALGSSDGARLFAGLAEAPEAVAGRAAV